MTERICEGLMCDKPSGDGFICRACLRMLEKVLAEVPWLLHELDVAEAKESRFAANGDKVTTIGGHLPMPIDISAVDARRDLHDRLALWVADLSGVVADSTKKPKALKAAQAKARAVTALSAYAPTNASAWLIRHLESVRVFEAAGDLLEELCSARATAVYVIDRPAERRYLGECEFTYIPEGEMVATDPCTEPLWGRHGDSFAHCRVCGAEWLMEPRLEKIQAQAVENMDDRIMTATQAAETMVAFGLATDTTPAHLTDQIRKWADKGMLVKRIDLPTPAQRSRPGYRLGDVMDLVKAADQRKAEMAERRQRGKTTRRSA